MDRTRLIPAHPISTGKGSLFQWILCILCLLIILIYPTAQPVAGRGMNGSLPALDLSGRVSIQDGVSDGALAWGDYDNDGDLDLLASGTTSTGAGKTVIFTNNHGTFSESTSGFAQVQASSAAWGDYDNDGFLDVLLTGYIRVESGSNVIGFAAVYHNEPSGSGRTFVRKQTLPDIYQGSGTWGDYNNDGKLDILLTGYTDGAAPFAKIYKNNGNFNSTTIFDEATGQKLSVTAVGYSATAWADFDRNGYLDFALSGKADGDVPITQVYHNDRNNGFDVINLTGLWDGTVNFIDYNLDGYQDLLVTGNTGANITPNIHPTTILYRYNSSDGTFTAIQNTGLPNIWNSSVSIGDYNNDGYPDVVLAGKALADEPVSLPTQVYINNKDGTFSNANAGLPDGAGHVVAWGDFDGNRTLDLALTGVSVTSGSQETYYTYIYPNTPSPTGNNAPSAPVMRAACWDGDNRLTLRWSSASDSPAPSSSLTYNVRLGTDTNPQDILSPASDLSTGYHRLAAMGNTSTGTTGVFVNLPAGNYYWTVQAIDAAYIGGPFDATAGREIHLGTPVASNDTYRVWDNQQNVSFNVLGNDAGNSLTIYSYTNPAHGTLTRDTANNALLYTPNQPYEGGDSFTYYAIQGDTLYCSLATVKITVDQHNDPPTDISLSNNQVPDGSPVGTLVGRLSTTDPDINQSFIYTLVSGTGYDSSAFQINGNQLYTNTVMDYAAKSSYRIRVRSTDNDGLWYEKDFDIFVIASHSPTDINLNPTSVLENQAIGTTVGTLTTSDPDPGDTSFMYQLVHDPENPDNNFDNDLFYITSGGTKLRTNTIFDHRTRETYQVRVRSTDRGGLFVEKVFTITILPTTPSLFWLDTIGSQHPSTEPLPVISMSEDGEDGYGQADPFRLTVLAKDLGVNETLTWSISRQASHGTAAASGSTKSGDQKVIAYTPQADWNSANERSNDSFVVRVTDSTENYVELLVTVNVKAVNDPPRFNPIDPQSYNMPGEYSVTITGIAPGPANESDQIIYFDVYCLSQNNCDATRITNLKVTPNRVTGSGTATLTFILNPGVQTGAFSIKVVARDNQPLKNTFALNFDVSISGSWKNFFLPILRR